MFTQKVLLNRRLLAVLILGFASGLPLGLTGSTLQAWFTETNVNLMAIGSLSLLGLPYALKFIWAPLMDHYSLPGLGKRRGWILLSQIALVLSLVVLANMQPATQAAAMGVVALLVAFFSASQDTAISAYQTDILQDAERGLGAAYYVFTYRLAVLTSGGLALVMAQYLNWHNTYLIMAALLVITMLMSCFAPKPKEVQVQVSHLEDTIRAALSDLFSKEKIVLIVLFIIFYKFGDALALSLMTNFLLHGLGFSLVEVGLAYKSVSFIATVMGAFIGGLLLTRWSIYKALLWFGLAQAFSNLTFVILALMGKSFIGMTLSIFIENFCSGLSTAALLAFLMSLCNKSYTASQFAFLSAISSLGRVLLGPVASYMVQHLGWVSFYLWAFALCFPGIVFLILLKQEVSQHVSAVLE